MTYLAFQNLDTESGRLPVSLRTNSGGGVVVFEMPESIQFVVRGTAFDNSTDRFVRGLDDILRRFFLDAGWLDDCIAELEETAEEAHEEGIAPPSRLAVSIAREMLVAAARMNLPEPAVYPTEESAVAILFKEEQSGVLILCEADGSFACFSQINGRNERARYSVASATPGAFIVEHLQRLERL